MIEAIEEILPTINDSTRLIPGHGPVGNIDDLRTFKLMLATVEEKILKLIEEGKTVEEVIAAKPSKNFDESWSWSFMPPDRWVSIVYDSIVFPEKASASDLSGN